MAAILRLLLLPLQQVAAVAGLVTQVLEAAQEVQAVLVAGRGKIQQVVLQAVQVHLDKVLQVALAQALLGHRVVVVRAQ
jgi:hypothetical protein